MRDGLTDNRENEIKRVLDKMVAYGWVQAYVTIDGNPLANIKWTRSGVNTIAKLLKPMLFEGGLNLEPGDEKAFMMILDEFDVKP